MSVLKTTKTWFKLDAVISYKDGEYHVAYANTDASKTSVTRQVLRTSIASEDTNQLLARVKQSLPQLQLKVKSPEIKESYEYGNEDTGFFAKMIPVLIGFVVFFFVFLISGMALFMAICCLTALLPYCRQE